jgi:hypothetical protein
LGARIAIGMLRIMTDRSSIDPDGSSEMPPAAKPLA